MRFLRNKGMCTLYMYKYLIIFNIYTYKQHECRKQYQLYTVTNQKYIYPKLCSLLKILKIFTGIARGTEQDILLLWPWSSSHERLSSGPATNIPIITLVNRYTAADILSFVSSDQQLLMVVYKQVQKYFRAVSMIKENIRKLWK